ncbi:acetylcholine receptor subunit alpha isoform X2 [Cimex lectularius]|nr:acetylcholine receptor subunit alpha isoform X2 [Cimex lectularius]
MNFSVMGRSDAHIMLLPNLIQTRQDVTYEVVIGAASNTYSSLRKSPKLPKHLDVSTPHIMNANHPVNFWIKISDETITVGKKGEPAFITYKEKMVKQLSFASFGAYTGITLMWQFGCTENKTIMEDEIVSDLERLKQDLFLEYDPYAVPVDDSTLFVDTKLDIYHVDLDTKSSVLSTHAELKMEWFDQKLLWNETYYNGLSHLYLYIRKIWLPDVTVLNAAHGTLTDYNKFDSPVIKIFNNGTVKWSPKIIFKTWCKSDISDWPWDTQNCDINIGLLQDFNAVRFSLSETPDDYINIHGHEWKIENVIGESILFRKEIENETISASNVLKIQLKLVRQGESILYIFILPTIVLVTIIPSLICLPPLSITKSYLILCSILALVLFLLTEVTILPSLTSSTPKIIQLTSKLLFLLCLQMALIPFIKHLAVLTTQPPRWMTNYLKHKLTSLLLPSTNLNELENVPDESSEEKSQNVDSHWKMLAILLDRLIQIVIVIIIIPIELSLTIHS